MEGIDLSFVSTEDLTKELLKRQDNEIRKAVTEINKNISLINKFGLDIEHEEENIRLLPNFWIDINDRGKIAKISYKDEEY